MPKPVLRFIKILLKPTNIFCTALAICLTACNNQDDLCINATPTPRLNIKFKDSRGNPARLDSVYWSVRKSGTSESNPETRVGVRADSVLVPLHANPGEYSVLEIRTRKAVAATVIRIEAQPRPEYISAACGFRLVYQGLSAGVEKPSEFLTFNLLRPAFSDETSAALVLVAR